MISVPEIVILIIAGFSTGFINTLAGGGTIITLSVLMFMGLPAPLANGTNRIAVVLQNAVAVTTFIRKKQIHWPRDLRFCWPVILGSVAGSSIASVFSEQHLEKAIAGTMLFMLFLLFWKPQRWLKGKIELQEKKITVWSFLIFFLIGIYGGFIHMGVGFFLLAGLVLSSGFDLGRANAIKNLIVLTYSIVALIVFVVNGLVDFRYGLIMSIGNIIGAYIASKFAVNWGAGFIRWVVVAVILITSAQLLGFIDIRSALNSWMTGVM